MSLQALSDYTFVSRYARFNTEKNRRETWSEAVERVKNMHLVKYPMVRDEIEWAFSHVHNKVALGSQRALQFGGEPILKKNARIYNCISSYIDRPRVFQETFWLLLCGCGTGFSVQTHHVNKLPEFHSGLNSINDFDKTVIYQVDDSIEGWADALGVLIASYLPHDEFEPFYGKRINFDFSKIRPKGSMLSYGVGRAPGPDGLASSLVKIQTLLDSCLDSGRRRLRSIDAYDIIMHSSDAVLSGGVRRSATLCIFSPEDTDMLNAKIGDWYYTNPQRARSNNSALLIKDSTSRDTYHRLFESTRQFGEPGLIWADNSEALYNPCITSDSFITTKNGIEQVLNLIGKQFDAVVDGKIYQSSSKGFWKTGNKEIIELVFESGRKLKCTSNHKIMTVDGWQEAGDIPIDKEVIIHDHKDFNEFNIDLESSDYARGYLLGSMIGDGNFTEASCSLKWWGEDKFEYRKDAYVLLEKAGWLNNHHGKSSKEFLSNDYCSVDSQKLNTFAKARNCLTDNGKKLANEACVGSWSYLSGLVAGYFDADGTVLFNKEKGSSLRVWSVQKDNLINLQAILNSFGIKSVIYNNRRKNETATLPDGKGGHKEYVVQKSYELCVTRNSIDRFANVIKLRNVEKIDKLRIIIESRTKTPYRSVFIDKLVSKESLGYEDVYDCTIPGIHAFDANGVYVHNCVEIGLYAYDEQGNSGWQACNLSTINGSLLTTKSNFAVGAEVSAVLGTLQAGYTDFAYLGPISESIIRREALLGVSITGIMDHPKITLDKNNLKEMAQLVLFTNERIAEKIGINVASRTTCVKPEGTASCLLGTSSGVHPSHARKYIRRVQSNAMEAPVQHYKLHNPSAVQKSVWSANGTDEVINFLIEMSDDVVTKDDITAVQLLETVKLVQENWVDAGKRTEKCVQSWLSHNVSNTINVKPEEWPAVEEYIYENRKAFAGISLLGSTGDLDYPQAPFTKVLSVEEIVEKYGKGALFASGLIVDALHAFNNNLWQACDAVLGNMGVIEPSVPLKIDDEILEALTHDWKIYNMKLDWIRRAKQFAERYINGDIRQLTYLLKDVNNTKFWQDLSRDHLEVKWELLYEEEDNTKLQENVACGANGCEMK